jgi:hypothetical protein
MGPPGKFKRVNGEVVRRTVIRVLSRERQPNPVPVGDTERQTCQLAFPHPHHGLPSLAMTRTDGYAPMPRLLRVAYARLDGPWRRASSTARYRYQVAIERCGAQASPSSASALGFG